MYICIYAYKKNDVCELRICIQSSGDIRVWCVRACQISLYLYIFIYIPYMLRICTYTCYNGRTRMRSVAHYIRYWFAVRCRNVCYSMAIALPTKFHMGESHFIRIKEKTYYSYYGCFLTKNISMH